MRRFGALRDQLARLRTSLTCSTFHGPSRRTTTIMPTASYEIRGRGSGATAAGMFDAALDNMKRVRRYNDHVVVCSAAMTTHRSYLFVIMSAWTLTLSSSVVARATPSCSAKVENWTMRKVAGATRCTATLAGSTCVRTSLARPSRSAELRRCRCRRRCCCRAYIHGLGPTSDLTSRTRTQPRDREDSQDSVNSLKSTGTDQGSGRVVFLYAATMVPEVRVLVCGIKSVLSQS